MLALILLLSVIGSDEGRGVERHADSSIGRDRCGIGSSSETTDPIDRSVEPTDRAGNSANPGRPSSEPMKFHQQGEDEIKLEPGDEWGYRDWRHEA